MAIQEIDENIPMTNILLSINKGGSLNNKIAAIKGIRALTGMGLKEAKITVESINVFNSRHIVAHYNIVDPSVAENLERIRNAGIVVQVMHRHDPVREGVADKIREVVSWATLAGQYDISRSLINVLEMHCPSSVEVKEEETEDDDRN